MVEAGANELPEEVILEAILFGHEEIKKIVAFQDEMQKAVGKAKREVKLFAVPEEMEQAADLFVLCVKLVSVEKILENK